MTTTTTELEAPATSTRESAPSARSRARQRWEGTTSPTARRSALGVATLVLALLAGLTGFGIGRAGAADPVTPTGPGTRPAGTGPADGATPQDGTQQLQPPSDSGPGTVPDGLQDYGLTPETDTGSGTDTTTGTGAAALRA